MALVTGTKLGPYELAGAIGAGGMGEVYRARDTRLGREVAVKILPPFFLADVSRLRRFEQEARAAAALNDPHILAVYDIGTYRPTSAEGTAAVAAALECPYIVSELLHGETLRERLRGGSLPVRKAVEYAQQLARGLGAAHDKGIVHRDLKPENIFITEDGRVKILDFGLAKLTRSETTADGQTLTQAVDSEAGTVLGTVGYMSPEQVRGKPTDGRSDLFSLGAILYEMLSGKRAFHGESPAETMSAIVKDEPPELTETNRAVPPALERVVRHCLEKNPAERFQSARDVAFDLEMMSGISQSSARARPVTPAVRLRRFAPLLWILALIATAVGAFLVGDRGTPTPPQFHALSYERGAIPNARFAADGRSIVYDATWDGKPVRVFTTPSESAQPRALELEQAHLFAVSRSGDIAVGLGGKLGNHLDIRGATLGRAPLAGGAPREILDNVAEADWAPDGTLAVVHTVNGHDRIEYPIGRVLYETGAWITSVRFSPKGDQIAFVEHPLWPDDRGWVAVVDTSGHKRTLSEEFESVVGLAWAPGGEIWFTATYGDQYRSLQAVSLNGRRRTVLTVPGALRLYDVSADGRVLLALDNEKVGMKAFAPGDKGERELSWSGWTIAGDISPDNKRVFFSEESVIAGPNYIVAVRSFDGSAPVRLGEGQAGTYSQDGKWVSAVPPGKSPRTALYPTGVGATREIPANLQKLSYAGIIDSRHLLLVGYEAGRASRCYYQDTDTGKMRAVTPEGSAYCVSSPDGQSVAAPDADGKLTIYSVASGEMRMVPGNTSGLVPIRWSIDGSVYARGGWGELPLRIVRIDPSSGRQSTVRELAPADPAGLIGIQPVRLSADASAYAYSYRRTLSEMYVVDGLK